MKSMTRLFVLFLLSASVLTAGCGRAYVSNSTADQSIGDDTSGSSLSDVFDDTEEMPDLPSSGLDEGLVVVLSEISATVHPGEAGMTLKAVQAASDMLDFALGTSLDADTIEEQTGSYRASLEGDSTEVFPEQVLFISDILDTLESGGGQNLMTDAGISDSSYPWSEEAFERARAIVRACDD